MNDFAQRLRTLREERGWTQAKLAEEAKIGQGYISSLETGRFSNPGRFVLIKLADVFDVSVDFLLGRE